ncbi:ImmA/IrrE family metallo-endopeptidase [Niallia alba]|uniref:ImmA/IrrE family metallo-endopeptidase n=1 Tax=Niallia circulans TaxID=1397 RepID=A0A941GC52_NIACI|nr:MULTISPECIES: ImmA/IrrE family metallo-endopeptidase [Niallia]MCB5236689.1 ImmA/IrrE family metallo-endopeptidase [Niallia circulans]MED3792140.1 ImmA/IrrE family metallo-endopeptidase [Niallia alba]
MEYIEKKVRTLLNRYKTSNPIKLAEALGIVVIHENLGNTLGYYSKHYRFKIIHLNEKLDEEKLEFVCAHELGHAILHPDSNTPFLKKNTMFSTDKIEMEANIFAMNLLFKEKELNNQLTIELALNRYGIPQKLLSKIF